MQNSVTDVLVRLNLI